MTAPPSEFARNRLFWAWLFLCLALALHVADEAATGFLSVYNPTALALRARAPWLPLPVFTFRTWLGGLIAADGLLLSLAPLVRRGFRWMRAAAWVLATVMLANSLGHVVGTVFGRTVASVRFPRPMPGFYSSPALLAASVYLICELRRR